MTSTHTLTRHKDIQDWVSGRSGLPAIARVRNTFGEVRAKLGIRFNKRTSPAEMDTKSVADEGLSPVSWTAWLAELDRQGLALKVGNDGDYELVARRELN